MVKNIIRLLIFLLGVVILSCENKNDQKQLIKSPNDSPIVDTLVNNYNLIVVTNKGVDTGVFDEVNTWIRFPESLTFKNFKSPETVFSKFISKELDFHSLEIEKLPIEIRAEIIDSLNKKNKEIKKPNFNRNYKILTTEVGNDCCGHFLVNLSTGMVTKMGFSLWGAEFQEDSYLVLINPINGIYKYLNYSKEKFEIRGYYPTNSIFRGPEAYIFIDKEFKRIY
jgi:hypothetical protein